MPTWSSRISAQECWNTENLGWEELSRINPKLVMVKISGYGQTGPYRDRPGFGASGEALGGIRYTKGSPDRPPFRTGIPSANSAFNNTRGLVLANICAAFDSGAVRFDASLGGLGGCPFAPGATANVCTEDVMHVFDQMGVPSSVDLAALLTLAKCLPTLLGHDVPGQVVKAGRYCELHPVPAGL